MSHFREEVEQREVGQGEGGLGGVCVLGHPAGAEEDQDADAGQALQALEVEEEEEVGKVRGHFQE